MNTVHHIMEVGFACKLSGVECSYADVISSCDIICLSHCYMTDYYM